MRIGIDATCWWNRRGFGRFTRELLKAMIADTKGHELCLFVDREPAEEMDDPRIKVVRVATARTVTESAVASSSRSVRDILAFRRAALAESLDVLFYPAVYSWFPVGCGLPSVVTLHDAIHEHYPDLVFPNPWRRLLWSLKLHFACRQAGRILTVSKAAKAEIVEYIKLDPIRIDVTNGAADARFKRLNDMSSRAEARHRAGLPARGRILIYVGGFAPHKNLSRMLDGFGRALDRDCVADLHLALVGDPAGDGFLSNYSELADQVDGSARLRERVHFTGFVSDEDLIALYSEAMAAVMPALSEGFGLPAIEALACATPVLSSDRGAVPEVIGEAGLLYDPTSPDAIAAAIERIGCEHDTRRALQAKAVQRARQYTWSLAAERTFAALEACHGQSQTKLA